MRSVVTIAFCVILASSAIGQEDDKGDMAEGLDLLSEGTRLLMEGLMQELAPALEGLRDGLDDLNAYHPPEMLPNGDIIIRRRTPSADDSPENGVDL